MNRLKNTIFAQQLADIIIKKLFTLSCRVTLISLLEVLRSPLEVAQKTFTCSKVTIKTAGKCKKC